MKLCNFDCAYCIDQRHRRENPKQMWLNGYTPALFRGILEGITRFPYRVRIRLQTLGEPFVSKEFLEGAAWLSRQNNIDFVELVTNGSFRACRFAAFAESARIEKVSLWMTYHPGQIEMKRLVDAARLARDAGAFVVVNTILFPNALNEIEELHKLCQSAKLQTSVTLGFNANGAFQGSGWIPIATANADALHRLFPHEVVLQAAAKALTCPAGEPCSAGRAYVYVAQDGDVYPCEPYSWSFRGSKFGNLLECGFRLELPPRGFATCRAPRCSCPEDYYHLKTVRNCLRPSHSLQYLEKS